MLRFVLAIYLSLVTLAGPWFCCCIVLRVFAHLMPEVQIDQHDAATMPPCCTHNKPTKVPISRAPEKPSDNPLSPECPCHRHQERVAAVPPAQADAPTAMETALVFLDLVAPDLAVESALLESCIPLSAPWNVLPFLSATDLRCALHIMRC